MTLFDLFNEAETLQQPFVQEPDEAILVKAHKKKKARRGEKLSDLLVEVIEYTLDAVEQVCDVCGGPLTQMKKEIRKEIKVVPAQVSIVEHVTYYSCRACDKSGEGGFIKSTSPPGLFAKSLVSLVSLLISSIKNMPMPNRYTASNRKLRG